MATIYEKQLEKITNSEGFVAALDQSGGSSPKALRLYGVPDDSYIPGEKSMFDAIHEMRTRIIASPVFNGDRILAAILFEDTMLRNIEGKPAPTYLWEEKDIVPIVKVDEGLQAELNGVQLMKPMKKLDNILDQALELRVFGTKMRSVIKLANDKGIKDIVDQQFSTAKHILHRGLHPILEPEVDIHSPEKVEAETLLKGHIIQGLNKLKSNERVLLKLTLPTVDNFYEEVAEHPNVLRIVALSGGYSREEANNILGRNKKMVASFSRALTEGLGRTDSDDDFSRKLDASVGSIFSASTNKKSDGIDIDSVNRSSSHSHEKK